MYRCPNCTSRAWFTREGWCEVLLEDVVSGRGDLAASTDVEYGEPIGTPLLRCRACQYAGSEPQFRTRNSQEWAAVQEAYRDWCLHQLSVDNQGNYRLRHLYRKPMAPYNRLIKRLYPKHQGFHDDAQAWREATPGKKGKPSCLSMNSMTTP